MQKTPARKWKAHQAKLARAKTDETQEGSQEMTEIRSCGDSVVTQVTIDPQESSIYKGFKASTR
jgi:hypothetical protein